MQLEDQKIKELMKDVRKKGEKVITAGDTSFNNPEFEDFQQKAGKMMYEQDEILRETWI